MNPSTQSGRVFEFIANEITTDHNEDDTGDSLTRRTMLSTAANLGSKLPAYQRQQLLGTQASEEEVTAVLHQLHGMPTRLTHYIWHPGPTLNDSRYVWYDDDKHLVRFCAFASEDMTVLTCKDDSQKKTPSQLLDSFCQRVDHPTTVDELNFTLIAMLTSFLLQAYDGSGFSKFDKIWGIQGIAEVDRNKHLKVLTKRLGGKGIEILNLGNQVVLHKDEGMLHRGLLNYSIVGETNRNEFAFVVIIDINHKDYIETFEYQAPAFDVILALGCLNFYRAKSLFTDPAYHTEAARLRRQIGNGAFRRHSRPAETAEEGEEVEVEQVAMAPSSPHRQPKKKRKGLRKSKKSKREAAVGEAERVEEVTKDPTIVDDAGLTTTTTTTTRPLVPSSLPHPPSPPLIDVFTFSRPHPLLTCAHPECNLSTHTTEEGTIVICPRCTPYSSIRYCKVDHLLDPTAIRAHFLAADLIQRCGVTSLLRRPVDDTLASIPNSCLSPHPYVHEELSSRTTNFPKNILERHRQAVWRSMRFSVTTADSSENRKDYYIFNDLDQIHNRLGITPLNLQSASKETQKSWLNQVRGLGELIASITISSTATTWVCTDGVLQITNLRDKFNEAVDKCLRLGYAAGTLATDDCMFVYTVVRAELRKIGVWDAGMCEVLVVQMGFEFGWSCPEDERVAGRGGLGEVVQQIMATRVQREATTKRNTRWVRETYI